MKHSSKLKLSLTKVSLAGMALSMMFQPLYADSTVESRSVTNRYPWSVATQCQITDEFLLEDFRSRGIDIQPYKSTSKMHAQYFPTDAKLKTRDELEKRLDDMTSTGSIGQLNSLIQKLNTIDHDIYRILEAKAKLKYLNDHEIADTSPEIRKLMQRRNALLQEKETIQSEQTAIEESEQYKAELASFEDLKEVRNRGPYWTDSAEFIGSGMTSTADRQRQFDFEKVIIEKIAEQRSIIKNNSDNKDIQEQARAKIESFQKSLSLAQKALNRKYGRIEIRRLTSEFFSDAPLGRNHEVTVVPVDSSVSAIKLIIVDCKLWDIDLLQKDSKKWRGLGWGTTTEELKAVNRYSITSLFTASEDYKTREERYASENRKGLAGAVKVVGDAVRELIGPPRYYGIR